MTEWDHLVPATPLDAEAAALLDAFEDVLGHPAAPLRLYLVNDGIAYWDPQNRDITLLESPHGQAYLASITPEDVDGADELEDLLDERLGGDER